MVRARGRPIDLALQPDVAPCIRCDRVYPKADYLKREGGKRCRVCNACKEKEEKKKSGKIEYTVEDFDISRVKDSLKLANKEKTGATIGIFGQSKVAGKTTLLKKIVDIAKGSFDFIVLFTVNTQASIYDELKMMPNFRISYKFDPLIVNMFHKMNSQIDKEKRLSVLFILDDEIDSKLSNTLRNMILTYRNMNISTVICSQAYSIVDKKSRGNFNFIFLGRFNSDEHIRDIVDIYLLSMLKSSTGNISKKVGVPALVQYYREKTAGYHFLVLDNLLDDFKVQIYKA